ncbi:MAG TPA: DUF1801 domain-containing protein [Candidatus Kapabacteria bacterium]|nr:DUF1801 domain-containing protein [Candidatus Kapabacteria bacterium]
MAKTSPANDAASVDAHIAELPVAQLPLVQAIRKVILSASKQVGEHIKWNAPAFFYLGEIENFDAKKYDRDIVVMNLRQKDHILLIFPTGERVKDVSPILEGDYTDGRRMVKIFDASDLKAKEKDLKNVIKAWVALHG